MVIDFTLINKAVKSILKKRLHVSENWTWTVIAIKASSHFTKGYHSFMRECCNTGLSLKMYRVIKYHAQRKQLYGITKIFKLIRIRRRFFFGT